MKKISLGVVISLCVACFAFSCAQINNDVSITVTDSDDYYKILAHYDEQKSAKIDSYIKRRLSKNNNLSFNKQHIDSRITLKNGTRFYMKKKPGYLSIKINKHENTKASLAEFKNVGEGLKTVIIQ